MGISFVLIFTLIQGQPVKAATNSYSVEYDGTTYDIQFSDISDSVVEVLVEEDNGSYTKAEYNTDSNTYTYEEHEYIGRTWYGGKKYKVNKDNVELSNYEESKKTKNIKVQASWSTKTYERDTWKYWYRNKVENRATYYQCGCNATATKSLEYGCYPNEIKDFKSDISNVNSSMIKTAAALGAADAALIGGLISGGPTMGAGAIVGLVLSLGGGLTAVVFVIDWQTAYSAVRSDWNNTLRFYR